MHFRMLVTTSLPENGDSEEARWTVYDALLHDDSFCGTGGRFSSPLCDWFVIGGRWSGLLAKTLIGEKHRAAVVARFPEMAKWFWPESLIDAHRDEFDAIWRDHGGSGPSPYTRDSYMELGYPDDAMLLTRELYDSLLAPYESERLVLEGDHGHYLDLDDDPLQPDAIGHKWLVVVNYHN